MFGFKSKKRRAQERRTRIAADQRYDREVEAARRLRDRPLRDGEIETRLGRFDPEFTVLDGGSRYDDDDRGSSW
jgi:hypothetical protein